MLSESMVLVLGYIVGFYMSWNIGANDVANSMASAVGAKAITIRQAILIAGILNCVGATFIGAHVTNTIRKGIVSTEVLSDPHLALIGAFSALLAAALWVSFATWKSLPVSTTHSIVGAMIGFGIMAGGFAVINWGKLGAVIASWVISPIFSLIIAWSMFNIIVKFVLRKRDAFHWALMLSPVFIGLTVFVVVLSFLFKTPLGKTLSLGTPVAIMTGMIIALLFGLVGRLLLTRFVPNDESGTEEIFRKIQIGTSCYVALAQGANDVANAIGPLAVIYFLVKTGTVGVQVPVPIYLLLFGGVGIACGIGMAGHRVMDTIGNKITTLTNTRGFAVDFAAATTVLIASKLGLPVSTTHAAVGGVMGVGLARGIEAVNFRILYKIVLYWILTVPAAALTSMIVFKLLELIM
jgi:PiT family inorganic phosphate transporter